MEHICCLPVVTTLLIETLHFQRKLYVAGFTGLVPGLDALFMLHQYMRWGVCGRTRTFASREMPDLSPLLSQLPRSVRTKLEAAIVLEEVGHLLSPTARGLLISEVNGQPIQLEHQEAQG